jgi:PAS domain S-box-containing protein
MKMIKLGIALASFVLIGIAIFGVILNQQENETKIKELLYRGNYLASLIALYPTNDFSGKKQEYLLKTLSEYTSYEGLIYCFIHDQSDQPIVSLVPDELTFSIPYNIQAASLQADGSIKQSFHLEGTKNQYFEFAKPIYDQGQKTGTVRLGFKLPYRPFFSHERVRFLSIVALFIFSALLLLYYGITITLQPLKIFNQDLKNTCQGHDILTSETTTNKNIVCMVEDFGDNLTQIKEKLTKIEGNNLKLASKLGVTAFEKKQIETILDSINLGIIIVDIQYNISHINQYMSHLIGKTKKQSIGYSLDSILEHEEIRSFIAKQDDSMGYLIGNNIETTFSEHAPGDTFNISVSELKNNDNNLMGKMIITRKITNEKMAEEARKDFIAHLSHEFKTPLTTIKSYSEMLIDGEIDERELKKEFYNVINIEADRLASLVQNLLSISRMEMGNLTLNKALVKTELLVKDSFAAIETAAKNKNIFLEENVSENSTSLVGDKELLKVAIINILNNAIKYTPENGKVAFSIFNQNGFIVFDVVDTGIGISREDLPHIFDKTYRSSDPQVIEKPGSGLGLAITQEIIQLHGGEIEVNSETGKGTHFAIKLPKDEYYLGKN